MLHKKITMSNMICPLSSVDPLRHKANPPKAKFKKVCLSLLALTLC